MKNKHKKNKKITKSTSFRGAFFMQKRSVYKGFKQCTIQPCIITIEDSAELQIKKIPNLVKLETRNANVEGKNAITIRDLIKSA